MLDKPNEEEDKEVGGLEGDVYKWRLRSGDGVAE
jgi:hypothetical protein